jgi:dTDP-glucose 4,6-dehydratase
MSTGIVQEDIRAVVGRVGRAFERLAGKTILLTGGTGFIGSYLLETLAYVNDEVLPRPCQVQAVTRDPSRVWKRLPHLRGRTDLRLLEADVRTFRRESASWDFVIHGAAPADARGFMRDPLGTVQTIVEGTGAVLGAVAEAKVQRLLFLSTGAVYGHQPVEQPWLPETHGGGPDTRDFRSCYAEAKRCAESLCRIVEETRGVPVSIARLFALVGPYQDLNATSAVVDFIRQGLEGPVITIHDDGQTVRSYCYIADAVTALWKLLLDAEAGAAVNVGSDLEAVSFVELAHRVGRCLGKPVSVVVEGEPARGVLGRRYAPDVSRLFQVTGFRPATTLDEALSRTVAWMTERPRVGAPNP